MRRRLGRLYAKDKNDKKFPLKALLPRRKSQRTSRSWYDAYWNGNQGNTPKCVGYGWTHWLEDAPVIPGSKTHPAVDPNKVYKLAQQLDEWPGTNYDGSSVRGGAKAIRKLGFISAYHWAANLDEIIQWILEKGPVVVGTIWTEDMFTPNASGLIVPTGEVVGGHCYDLNGVSTITRKFRAKNSWGTSWGKGGHAYIKFEDMNTLLFPSSGEPGEACVATEKGVVSPKQ
jgi:hypothetical protein